MILQFTSSSSTLNVISSNLFTGMYPLGRWWGGVKNCLPIRQVWSFSSSMPYCFIFLFMPTITWNLGSSHELLPFASNIEKSSRILYIWRWSPLPKKSVFNIVCPCLFNVLTCRQSYMNLAGVIPTPQDLLFLPHNGKYSIILSHCQCPSCRPSRGFQPSYQPFT